MEDLYNVMFIANHLGVAPATVYSWLNQDGEWDHDPIPTPVARIHSPGYSEIGSPVWNEAQLYSWHTWYVSFKKPKNPPKPNKKSKKDLPKVYPKKKEDMEESKDESYPKYTWMSQ